MPDAATRAIDLAFAPAASPADAEASVRELATSHYENFSVLSRLVPRRLRQDFANVYAFCRTADDLGDELGDPGESLRHLAELRRSLDDAYAGRPRGAVMVALAGTIERHAIPREPFADLISAFEQDQRVTRYATFAELLDYCRRSADPVGRLVLYLYGFRDAERQSFSDATCTALQLANFWQDVRRDLDNLDRVYLPGEWLDRFSVTVDSLRAGRADDGFRSMIRHAVDETEALFARGDGLLPLLPGGVRSQVALFAAGGRAVLAAIRRQGYDTLSRRPTVSKWTKATLVARMVGARALARIGGEAA